MVVFFFALCRTRLFIKGTRCLSALNYLFEVLTRSTADFFKFSSCRCLKNWNANFSEHVNYYTIITHTWRRVSRVIPQHNTNSLGDDFMMVCFILLSLMNKYPHSMIFIIFIAEYKTCTHLFSHFD